MTETVTLVFWCRRVQVGRVVALEAVGVDLLGGGLSARPGPQTIEMLFRHTGTDEFPAGQPGPAEPGFKIYGVGRWPAQSLGGTDHDPGRREPFAVTPKRAADVLNGLLRMGWKLTAGPPHLEGCHERAWEPKGPDDVRPIRAEDVLAAVAGS